MIKSSILTVENYTRLSLIYKEDEEENENNIDVYTSSVYKSVDVRSAHIFYQKGKRGRKERKETLLILIISIAFSLSLSLENEWSFFFTELYRERDTRDIVLLKQRKLNDKKKKRINSRIILTEFFYSTSE